MKKYNLVLFIVALLTINLKAGAQKTLNSYLKVGDKAPNLVAYQWLKGTAINQFIKGQTYLVDFGATWCHPCAEAIPHLTEIAKKYKGKLEVVGVFVMEYKKDNKDYDYVQKVRNYVNRFGSKMDYNVAVDDAKASTEKLWIKNAGLSGLPQVFIVDKNGMIAWIGNSNPDQLNQVVDLVTSPSYDLAEAIAAANKNGKFETQKNNQQYDNAEENKNLLYRSVLTKYNGEAGGNFDFVFSRSWAKMSRSDRPYEGMVQQIGVPIEKLYYMAYADTIGSMVFTRRPEYNWQYPDTIKKPIMKSSYGKYWYKAILEVQDTASFRFTYKHDSNRYNYSLIVPDEKATAKFLQEVMQKDLKSYFGFDVVVEERVMPYWKLIATEKTRTLLATKTPGEPYATKKVNDSLSRFTNAVVKDILVRFILSFSYANKSYGIEPIEKAPFIDESGIKGEIDYDISSREFEEMLNGNWEVALEFLHRLGLDLVKGEKSTKVVVIRDAK